MKWLNWKAALVALLSALLALLGHRQLPPPTPWSPPPPPPGTDTPPAANPLDALGRLVMVGGFCSATPISPLSAGGRQVLLSAAHCVKSVGEVCQFYTRGGRMVKVTVNAINREADCCLLVAEDLREPLPYLLVAIETPALHSRVFHAGFGEHKPGNVEKGRLIQRDTGSGQVMYELSVSPGDSGGGICVDATGRLISPVCCTTRIGQVGQVYGARPEEVQRMLSSPVSFLDVAPMKMPSRVEKLIKD